MLDYKILKEFGSIEALHLFLREKINDGEEISKGKSPTDQSKEQKKKEAEPNKPEKPDPAGDAEAETSDPAPEMSGPEGGAEMGADAEPVVDPVTSPGSQVAMGGIPNDEKGDKNIDNPDAIEIKLSKKKNKINKRPYVSLNNVR